MSARHLEDSMTPQGPRPSACAEAARRDVEAQTHHLTASQRSDDLHSFNRQLAELVRRGRIAK